MNRQNRTLGFTVAFSIVILGGLLWSNGILKTLIEPVGSEASSPEANKPHSDLESMGDAAPADGAAPEEAAEVKNGSVDIFADILKDLADCFRLPPRLNEPHHERTMASVVDFVSADFGPPLHQEDRWMSWYLRDREGIERRLRIEVTRTPEGALRRDMHYSSVDREGRQISIEHDPHRTQNPSDEAINQILREGTVIYKENAGSVDFSDSTKAEFVESEGQLSTLSMEHEPTLFKCTSLLARESCSCTRE